MRNSRSHVLSCHRPTRADTRGMTHRHWHQPLNPRLHDCAVASALRGCACAPRNMRRAPHIARRALQSARTDARMRACALTGPGCVAPSRTRRADRRSRRACAPARRAASSDSSCAHARCDVIAAAAARAARAVRAAVATVLDGGGDGGGGDGGGGDGGRGWRRWRWRRMPAGCEITSSSCRSGRTRCDTAAVAQRERDSNR